MKIAGTSKPAAPPEKQLEAFIGKFARKDQQRIRAIRRAVRKRFPTANELVYDNYNFFVIGYSPTERPSDAIVSIAARANGVGLCFIRGASLPDPKKVLLGSGNQTRFIRLESAGRAGASRGRSARRGSHCTVEDAPAGHRTREAHHPFGIKEAGRAAPDDVASMDAFLALELSCATVHSIAVPVADTGAHRQ